MAGKWLFLDKTRSKTSGFNAHFDSVRSGLEASILQTRTERIADSHPIVIGSKSTLPLNRRSSGSAVTSYR